MASAATTTIRRIAPEFAAITDDEVDAWVEIAALQHTAAPWGATYTLAMACYAAHLMARAGLGSGGASSTGGLGGGGPVSMVREQDLAVQFDTSAISAAASGMTPGDVDLTTTRYGLRYLAIRAGRAIGAGVVDVAGD